MIVVRKLGSYMVACSLLSRGTKHCAKVSLNTTQRQLPLTISVSAICVHKALRGPSLRT